MKRILFYLFLFLQIILLLFLMFQFERGYDEAETIKLKTSVPDYYMDDDFYNEVMGGTMYVDYEVSKIAADKWNNEETIDYNNRVYVLLEENDAGVFEVVTGSESQLTPTDHQVMLSAYYHYYDEKLKVHYVRYGFEEINNIETYGSFSHDEQLLVTILIGKWGQRKIEHVEKLE